MTEITRLYPIPSHRGIPLEEDQNVVLSWRSDEMCGQLNGLVYP